MSNDARPDAPTPQPAAEDLERSAMRWLAGALRWEGAFRSFGAPIAADASIIQAHDDQRSAAMHHVMSGYLALDHRATLLGEARSASAARAARTHRRARRRAMTVSPTAADG